MHLTTFIQNSDLPKIRLGPCLRNISSSVTLANVCTLTITGGETSDVGQTLQSPNIEIIVIMDCLYNMVLERPCNLESIATRLVKKARFVGLIKTCLLQENTLIVVNNICQLQEGGTRIIRVLAIIFFDIVCLL